MTTSWADSCLSFALRVLLLGMWLGPLDPLPAQTTQPALEGNAEGRTAQAFEAARKQGPLALRAFLYRMPKGADLHSHLAGAVYAESYVRAAGEDGMCVDTTKLAFVKADGTACPLGAVQATTVPQNQRLYDALIDAFSMRDFVPGSVSGHDHFFGTFARFGGTDKRHTGEWVDEVAARAAAQNVQYLELMETPNFTPVAGLATRIGYRQDFAQYRELLLAQGLRGYIPTIQAHFDQAETARREREQCGEPDPRPACAVEVRYIYQVLRGLPKEAVFAQVLLGFELASVDSLIVGLNLVQPEDCYTCLADYRLHMQMLDALHAFYPKVPITLHAGELEPGMVPPEDLRFHIRWAVQRGHAVRIGHGVDVMYEDQPADLLKAMAAKHIMVEINFTSNAVILNTKGADHPFTIYRQYGVPVALSTDDEGVSRIDLTHEYVHAALTYPLSYRDLKLLARTGMEHAFLPGMSLWQSAAIEKLGRPVAPCRGQLGRDSPVGSCADVVRASEKAHQQWELERRFHEFESRFR